MLKFAHPHDKIMVKSCSVKSFKYYNERIYLIFYLKQLKYVRLLTVNNDSNLNHYKSHTYIFWEKFINITNLIIVYGFYYVEDWMFH